MCPRHPRRRWRQWSLSAICIMSYLANKICCCCCRMLLRCISTRYRKSYIAFHENVEILHRLWWRGHAGFNFHTFADLFTVEWYACLQLLAETTNVGFDMCNVYTGYSRKQATKLHIFTTSSNTYVQYMHTFIVIRLTTFVSTANKREIKTCMNYRDKKPYIQEKEKRKHQQRTGKRLPDWLSSTETWFKGKKQQTHKKSIIFHFVQYVGEIGRLTLHASVHSYKHRVRKKEATVF